MTLPISEWPTRAESQNQRRKAPSRAGCTGRPAVVATAHYAMDAAGAVDRNRYRDPLANNAEADKGSIELFAAAPQTLFDSFAA
jgi:hypothetical protein